MPSLICVFMGTSLQSHPPELALSPHQHSASLARYPSTSRDNFLPRAIHLPCAIRPTRAFRLSRTVCPPGGGDWEQKLLKISLRARHFCSSGSASSTTPTGYLSSHCSGTAEPMSARDIKWMLTMLSKQVPEYSLTLLPFLNCSSGTSYVIK